MRLFDFWRVVSTTEFSISLAWRTRGVREGTAKELEPPSLGLAKITRKLAARITCCPTTAVRKREPTFFLFENSVRGALLVRALGQFGKHRCIATSK